MDQTQQEENITLEQALRRANLLAAAAEVSQNITQILDIEELLPKTVDIICEAYDFYYAGVFLIDEAGEFAVLRAGRGEPGRIMMENNHRLAVGGNSMIGACTAGNEARISLDVDTEKVWYPNPVLPKTRSEMALPLAIGQRVIGAVTVQSVEAAAFSDEDVSSLQAMANQLAIAIENARQRRELEAAHKALVQAKTFEAIATATGDAIHWIGNKAEPIEDAAGRVRYDLQVLTLVAGRLLEQAPDSLKAQGPAQLLLDEAATVRENSPALVDAAEKMSKLSPDKLTRQFSLASMLDDLEIIENAADLIMQVKEELIGPAREQAPRPTMVDDVAHDAVNSLALDPEVINLAAAENLPLVLADPVQLNRVLTNLLKNAQEATAQVDQPRINLALSPDAGENFVQIEISDNGPGIPEEDFDKIWISFHTTKGVSHSGLGLPACRLILEQIGGHITAVNNPNGGATFTVLIPITSEKGAAPTAEPGQGDILLIDDDDRWRQFAAEALDQAGYTVTLLGPDESEAVSDEHNLVLVDDLLSSPGSTEIYHSLKEAGAIAKTLAVTSNPRVERTKERLLLGLHTVLPKPYTAAGLLDDVAEALRSLKT